MFIKTVSTTSGINPIKFDETGGVFYWILNTGSSTIYASTKSAFTTGDDGVVSLGPKESRRLETNNDTIYILGEGQVEIHNQRDGICSFKQAPTSSGGGETVDAYTKTESDAKYAQKTDIPTTLPANGGNADTVDGYHVADDIHIDGDIPPKYFTDFLRIDDDNKSIERWTTDNLKVAFADHAAKAENADTVDGLHASDFVRAFNGSEMNNNRILIPNDVHVGDWLAANAEIGMQYYKRPDCSGQTGLPDGGNDWAWFLYDGVIYIAKTSYNRFFIMDYINSYNGWKEISTTPIKSTTLSGTTDVNGNLMLWAASENKIPICAILSGYCSLIFHYAPEGNYYLSVSDIITMAYCPDVPVSGTVYYIEV